MYEDSPLTPTEPLANAPAPRERPRAAGAAWSPPRVLRHYEHQRALGAGGMGYVHLYRDTKLQRLVAIKLIREREDRAQVLREARAAARIQHPNVVAIYEVDEDQGLIVTEYIAGQRLDAHPLPIAQPALLPLARDIARGLAEVHRCSMVHGDIKPANVIIEARTGRPKLIDFGLARHHSPQGLPSGPGHEAGGPAASRAVAGTPPYTAPELWTGQPPSPASDVFAFGVLLHLLGTGAMPPHVSGPRPDRPPDLRPGGAGLWPDVLDLIERCLDPDPRARPRDGQAVAACLARIEPSARDACSNDAARAGGVNPYLGLRPFDYAHRQLFFGRSDDIEAVLARLHQQQIVMVTGESGVGKSSLVQAGVRPRISDWAWTEARFAANPLGVLAGLLAGLASEQAPDQVADQVADQAAGAARAQAGEIEVLLRAKDWAGLARHCHEARPAGTVVWFLDQLEELLTTDAPGEAADIARALAWVIEHVPQLRILTTARSDAFARLAYLPALGEKIEQGAYLLRPLDQAALADVITEPARAVGLGFESEDLVAELAGAAAGVHGGLPLLQATLVELWMRRDRGRNIITRGGYEALGGVGGAITRYADRVYEALLPDKRELARRLLLRMVDRAPLRARRKIWRPRELARGERDLLARLVAERLVVAREIDGAPSYELAHDCLVSRWGQLRRWMNQEGDVLVTRQRLERDAAEWAGEQRSPDLLWSKRQLAAAHVLDPSEIPAIEADFLAASRGRVRRTRYLRGAVAAGILSLIALVYTGVRYQAARRIDGHIAVATSAYERARRNLSSAYARHQAMVARLRADPLDEDARASWPGVLAALAEVERGLRDANLRFDAILAMAPERDQVRRGAAALAYDRVRLARFLDRRHDVLELENKLRAYGTALGDRCRRPIPIALEVRPAPARLLVHRYELDSGGSFARMHSGEYELHHAVLRLRLAPGSYLLTVDADDERPEVRYPLELGCDSAPVDIELARPRHDAIPPGFVYVPAGPVRYGFGRNPDQELFRPWFETTPLHERHVGGFLIARHETTFGQWIELLDACPGHACPGIVARPPRVSAPASYESPLQLVAGQGEHHGRWILELRPAPEQGLDTVYRAAQGRALVYPGRERRREQAWERMPVTGVSWDDVQAYLRWLRWSGRVPGARLCREDEWERAARGADGRLYPHGNVLHPGDANYDLTYGRKALAYGLDEVGSYPASASPFGIEDMTGNAWEMVASWQRGDERAQAPVLRGGSYYHSALDAVTANRWVIERSDPDSRVGFRVCAPMPAAAP